MIAKKWHINEAPLQGSFLLLSPLKTIRWFEGGHGGSHLAQQSCGAQSSALRSPEAAAATVRAGTPQPTQTPFPLLARMECVVVFVELDLAVLVESEGPRLSTTGSPHLWLEKCSKCTKLDHRERW